MPFNNLPNGGDPNWITVLLSMLIAGWGGVINYITGIRKSSIGFSFRELLFEVFVSAFVGAIIGMLAMANGAGPLLSLSLAGMAGHAGGRTVFYLDRFWGNKLKSWLKSN